jgi:hypothetical protein
MTTRALSPKEKFTASERARMLLPAVGIPMGVMTAYVGQLLREEARGDTDEQKARMDKAARIAQMDLPFSQRWERAVQSSGVLGKYDPWVQLFTDVDYGRVPSSRALGPWGGQVQDLMVHTIQLGTDKNSPNTNTMERAVARDVYEAVVDPGLSALALVAGTPAVAVAVPQILDRKPAREAFQEATVGPKKKKGPKRAHGANE